MVKSERKGKLAEVSFATKAKELCRVCFRGRWPEAINAMDLRIASRTRVPCPACRGIAEHQFIDFRCGVLGNKIQHPIVQCKTVSAFRLLVTSTSFSETGMLAMLSYPGSKSFF